MSKKYKNIGFISTRLAGTDGVSLETQKWSDVITQMEHKCFYMVGEIKHYPQERSFVRKQLHFRHTEIQKISKACFHTHVRSASITQAIHSLRQRIKKHIYTFVKKFQIDLIIVENALTIPFNIPLGLALTEFISETNIPTIAHHHDFFWERPRFLPNAAWDYLDMAFPPHLASVYHIVINSFGSKQFALREGISSTLIPNVMDFHTPPPKIDSYNKNLRRDLGIADNELLILQPTRIVQRKGIEHAIEFVHRLNRKAKLVISHNSGDEGHQYRDRIKQYAKLLRVPLLIVADRVNTKRGKTKDGKKIYTLSDIYLHADLVTYPSLHEGFGNAFLEAIYFQKPILVNMYPVYRADIKPKGFQAIEFDGYITNKTIQDAKYLLDNPSAQKRIARYNYRIGEKYYSYVVLRRKLKTVLSECLSLYC